MVAEVLGVPEATVILHDRNLSLAGLRSMGGRGRAVARVTYTDAANLLIAVAGSRNVKDSAKTVETYRELTTSEPLTFNDGGQEVVRGKTFDDAIATLLEALPPTRADWHRDDYIKVSLFGPRPSARIEWELHDKGTRRIDYDLPWVRNRAATPFADLEFVSIFSQITLGFVGELIAEK